MTSCCYASKYWILLYHGFARIYVSVQRYPTLSGPAETIKCGLDAGGNLRLPLDALYRVSIRYTFHFVRSFNRGALTVLTAVKHLIYVQLEGNKHLRTVPLGG